MDYIQTKKIYFWKFQLEDVYAIKIGTIEQTWLDISQIYVIIIKAWIRKIRSWWRWLFFTAFKGLLYFWIHYNGEYFQFWRICFEHFKNKIQIYIKGQKLYNAMHCTTTKGDMKAEWLWYTFSLLKIEGVIMISGSNYYSSQTPSSHSMQYELRVRNMNALYNLLHRRVGLGGYESRRQVEDFQPQTVKKWIFFLN